MTSALQLWRSVFGKNIDIYQAFDQMIAEQEGRGRRQEIPNLLISKELQLRLLCTLQYCKNVLQQLQFDALRHKTFTLLHVWKS